jgi:hypothetical protein
MVGLRRARRNHRVAPLAQRLGHEKLELAGLVAAQGKSGKIIALDPKTRPPEVSGKTLQLHQRRRKKSQRAPGKHFFDRSHAKAYMPAARPKSWQFDFGLELAVNPSIVAALAKTESAITGKTDAGARAKAAETVAKQLARGGLKSLQNPFKGWQTLVDRHLEKIVKNPDSKSIQHWEKEIKIGRG